jgi:mono/diheme cytochrome c family protein
VRSTSCTKARASVRSFISSSVAVALVFAAAAATNGQPVAGDLLARGAQRIECAPAGAGVTGDAGCRVDVATYVGWRVFNVQCAICHAQDATGSSFAPDLTARLRGMEQRAFFTALDDGYMGPNDASPPRGANPDVARYYYELWSYLSARARGELPPGPLERLPNEVAPTER